MFDWFLNIPSLKCFKKNCFKNFGISKGKMLKIVLEMA